MSANREDGQSRSFGGLLALPYRALVAELHERLTAMGFPEIRPGSGNVFEFVSSGGSTVVEMARRAKVTPQAMVQIVDYLEAHGFVERTPDPGDRRAKIVRMTDRGQSAYQAGLHCMREIETEWAALIGAERFAALRDGLVALSAALDHERAYGKK